MDILLACIGVAVVLIAIGVTIYFISKSGLTARESPLETMLKTPIPHTTWETKTVYSPLDKTAKPVDIKKAEKNLDDSLNLLNNHTQSKSQTRKTAKQDKNTEKLKDLNKNFGLNLD